MSAAPIHTFRTVCLHEAFRLTEQGSLHKKLDALARQMTDLKGLTGVDLGRSPQILPGEDLLATEHRRLVRGYPRCQPPLQIRGRLDLLASGGDETGDAGAEQRHRRGLGHSGRGRSCCILRQADIVQQNADVVVDGDT